MSSPPESEREDDALLECRRHIEDPGGCLRGVSCPRKHIHSLRNLFQAGCISKLYLCGAHEACRLPEGACPFLHTRDTDEPTLSRVPPCASARIEVWHDTENCPVPAGRTAAQALSALEYAVCAVTGYAGPVLLRAFHGPRMPEPLRVSMRTHGAHLIDAGRKVGAVDHALKASLNDFMVDTLLGRLGGLEQAAAVPPLAAVPASTAGGGAALTTSDGDGARSGGGVGVSASETEGESSGATIATRRPPRSVAAAPPLLRSLVVLVSGDRDFGDDLRRLRRCGFETCCVYNGVAHPDYCTLADHALPWDALADLAAALAAQRTGGSPQRRGRSESAGPAGEGPGRGVSTGAIGGGGGGGRGRGRSAGPTELREDGAATGEDGRGGGKRGRSRPRRGRGGGRAAQAPDASGWDGAGAPVGFPGPPYRHPGFAAPAGSVPSVVFAGGGAPLGAGGWAAGWQPSPAAGPSHSSAESAHEASRDAEGLAPERGTQRDFHAQIRRQLRQRSPGAQPSGPYGHQRPRGRHMPAGAGYGETGDAFGYSTLPGRVPPAAALQGAASPSVLPAQYPWAHTGSALARSLAPLGSGGPPALDFPMLKAALQESWPSLGGAAGRLGGGASQQGSLALPPVRLRPVAAGL
jgi:hypothetical protein